MLPHYKVKEAIFILFDEAMNYCDKLKLPYSEIKKTYQY